MSIQWLPWGPAAFARARAEGRPVLLSLTAAWCHACHRMDEETWEAPGVAAAVEAQAVPVRADADQRPDLYARYHLGGLPSTLLLTAEGEFIRGGTFLSPPELLALLERGLADFSAGRRPVPRLAALQPGAEGPAERWLPERLGSRLLARADRQRGGFGEAPKLPEPESLLLLLRLWREAPERGVEDFLRLSLGAIARHLADPRDGGFFRYAAAADWSGPHTEKLALDQAALIRLYLEAGVALDERGYLAVARRALEHARSRLADRQGRVLASIAAWPPGRPLAEPTREGADPEPEGEGGDALDGGGAGAAVDSRRFADAGAAMLSAGLAARRVLGWDPGFSPEVLGRVEAGRVPHRLDADDGVGGLLLDQALAVQAALDLHEQGLREGEGAAPGSGISTNPRDAGGSRLGLAAQMARFTVDHLRAPAAGSLASGPVPAPGGPALAPMVPLGPNGHMALALVRLAGRLGPEAGAWALGAARGVIRALAPRASRSPAGAALGLAALALGQRPGGAGS